MITKTLLQYNLQQVIGEGGMGIVYKARDLNLDRLVAVKILPPSLSFSNDFNNRFIQEARTAARLDHPHICTIHEFDKTAEGRFYIVMAYYPGQTLAEIIHQETSLSLEKSLSIALQVGLGLGEAHRHGIIHRDLKPANIIVSEEGKVTILDFGLAGLREEINRQSGSTMAGTAAYMAPEQIIGNGIDQRSDLWSFGVIIYQMLSGHLPFEGEQEQMQLYPILKEEPPSLSFYRADVPNEVVDLIHRTLQKEPENRPPSAKAIVEELSVAQQKHFPLAVQDEQKRRRYIFQISFAIIIVLASLIAYLFYSRASEQTDPIRLAVMNFRSADNDSAFSWLSNGISEDIRSRLARIEGFRVMSRQAVQDYKTAGYTIPEVAANLNVSYILDGKIQKNEEGIYLVADLIDVENEVIHWTETYERSMANLFELQRDIAQEIALALQVTLSSTEQRNLENLETTNPLAYEYYQRGIEYYSRWTAWDNEHAIKFFKKSIAKDSTFASAYAYLSRALTNRAVPFRFELIWHDSALVMAEKALTLNPACLQAYIALGRLYARVTTFKQASFQKAAAFYTKALELMPNDWQALYFMGQLKRHMCIYNDALVYLKKSLEVNPKSTFAYAELGHVFQALGEYELAEKHFELALEINPENNHAIEGITYLNWEQGKYDEYIKILQKQIKRYPNNRWRYFTIGSIYKISGDFDKAIIAYNKSKELAPDEPWCDWGLASVALEQERYHEALEIFEKSFDNFPHSLIIGINYSFLLARLNQTDKARRIMDTLLNDSLLDNTWSSDLMISVSEFYLGKISGDSLHSATVIESDKCYKSRITRCYYYIGMAHLLNLRENYSKTVSDTLKAIAVLEDYVSKKPLQVGYSLASKELRDLKKQINRKIIYAD